MLSIKERQIKLTFLGYYSGKIDGIEGKLTKKAYLDLQNDYFVNNRYRHDIDGEYGKNTDILLCDLYLVKSICKHFTLKEFKCKCNNQYCSGYPAYLKEDLLTNLEKLRSYLNYPLSIQSGLRCKTHNRNVGGVSGSRHLIGKAVDFRNANNFKSLDSRKSIINKWVSYKNSRYGYTNGYANLKGKTSNIKATKMGITIHGDII